jgi:hypothetical protein
VSQAGHIGPTKRGRSPLHIYFFASQEFNFAITRKVAEMMDKEWTKVHDDLLCLLSVSRLTADFVGIDFGLSRLLAPG